MAVVILCLPGCAGTFAVKYPNHCPGDLQIVDQYGVHYTWDERHRQYVQDNLPLPPAVSLCGLVIKDKCLPVADMVVAALGKSVSDILPNSDDFHSPDQLILSKPSPARQLPTHWYTKVARFLHLIPAGALIQVAPSFAGNLVSGETSLIASPMPLK